jgi:hypothetical protein
MFSFDKVTYNFVVEQKVENEKLINEIYVNFNNYLPNDQYLMLDIAQNLAIINEELEKYIVVYNATAQEQQQASEYIVISGDTIHSIARNLTGDYNNWKEILRFNKLSDLELEVGSIILIPRELKNESV